MKNIYITSIPLQGKERLWKKKYIPQDGINFDEDMETAFPIIPVMKKTMDPEVENKVIVVVMKSTDSKENLELFKEELQDIDVNPKCVTCVELEEDSRYATGVSMFIQLAREIEDDSDVYACITYGTKIMSIVMTYVLSSIEYLKRNTVVKSVCYGHIDWENGEAKEAKVWDVMGILQINELVRTIFEARFDNPLKALENLLKID